MRQQNWSQDSNPLFPVYYDADDAEAEDGGSNEVGHMRKSVRRSVTAQGGLQKGKVSRMQNAGATV